MPQTRPVPEIDLPLLHSGKVRDMYDLGEERLLLVASDRISAFDVVMSSAVPNKGRVLTAMSDYWFDATADIVPNHRLQCRDLRLPEGVWDPYLEGRSTVARKAEMLPLECIVRGHLTGSAWNEYRQTGTVHKTPVKPGMQKSEAFDEPMFTPSTKAMHDHDENISITEARNLVGKELTSRLEEISLQIFARIRDKAAEKDIVVADTKFEFGIVDGELTLCDEVGTPDSSRFWPAAETHPGTTPPSYDKQPLRDYLEGTGWDKRPPPPELPEDVVMSTAALYQKAYERITGRRLMYWRGLHAQLGGWAVLLSEKSQPF